MHGLKQQSWIFISAIFFTMLLCVLSAIRTDVINPDGICYLQSAESMQSGLRAAVNLCGQARWPFYSMLIYGLAHATGFSFLFSAYLINFIFSIFSSVIFIFILRELNAPARVLWLGVLVFVLSHQLNIVRSDIIRDHGFWTFYLASVFFLIRFFHKPNWNYALLWSMSLGVASLFRIEGFSFLFILPFVTLLIPSLRIHAYLKLNILTFLALAGSGFWLWQHPNTNTDQLGRVGEIKFQLMHGFAEIKQTFLLNANDIAQHILNQYSAQDAIMILSLVVIVWYLMNVISAFSMIYALLLFYAWRQKVLAVDSLTRWVLWSYVLVAVMITGVFLTEHMFLSKRYLVALFLILMIWIPFALNNLFEKNKIIFSVSIILIFLSGLSGTLNISHSKQYIRSAAAWIEENVPPAAKLYSNDYHLMYYSHHFGQDIFHAFHTYTKETSGSDIWKHYDYLAFRFNKNDAANLSQIQNAHTPVMTFSNKRGDQVLIYKVN